MSIIFGQKGFAAMSRIHRAIHGTGNSFFMIDAMLPIQVPGGVPGPINAGYRDRLSC
jgi:hypothetical protein